jgi:hypothetical protein
LGDGLELNDRQLRSKIRSLMRLNPRPEIRLVPNRSASYGQIGRVLLAFQQTGYGPHLGFEGSSR